MATKFTSDEVIEKIREKNPYVKIISIPQKRGDYGNCQCLICGYKFQKEYRQLIDNPKCPVCSHAKIVSGYNDIPVTHPHIVPYFMNIDDSNGRSFSDKSKVWFKCPDCGFSEKKMISYVCKSGFNCKRCGDGISLPNKMIRNLLTQLPVENMIFEYHPNWANGKMYDVYFEYNNQPYIVEMNGAQHYRDTKWSSLEYQQSNDLLKEKMAKEHNINIFYIDAKKSELEQIKNNILKSPLNQVFDLSTIDWNECFVKSLKSRVVEICTFYKDHPKLTTSDIGAIFKIEPANVRDYLYKGTQCGLCYYNPKETNYKGQRYYFPYGFDNIPVKVYDIMGKYMGDYNNIYEAAEKLNQQFMDICINSNSIIGLFRKYGDNVAYKKRLIFQKRTPDDIGSVKKNRSKHSNIPVNVYDMNKNLLGTYDSIPAAAKDLNERFDAEVNSSGVRKAFRVRGDSVTYKGCYVFEKQIHTN